MKKISVFLLFTFTFLFYTQSVFAQEPAVLTFEEFQSRYLSGEQDTLYLFNFWATWCKPCVEELPYFERANKEFAHRPVKIILVSLDFLNQLERRVIPFLAAHAIQNEVVLLNAPRENIWIPKISEEWSGAIPATLIYHPKSGTKYFYEQTFNWDQLSQTINQNLKLCGN